MDFRILVFYFIMNRSLCWTENKERGSLQSGLDVWLVIAQSLFPFYFESYEEECLQFRNQAFCFLHPASVAGSVDTMLSVKS